MALDDIVQHLSGTDGATEQENDASQLVVSFVDVSKCETSLTALTRQHFLMRGGSKRWEHFGQLFEVSLAKF